MSSLFRFPVYCAVSSKHVRTFRSEYLDCIVAGWKTIFIPSYAANEHKYLQKLLMEIVSDSLKIKSDHWEYQAWLYL